MKDDANDESLYVAVQLQEPLLVEQPKPPEEEFCQRRVSTGDTNNFVEPFDIAEQEQEEEEWIGVQGLRCFWIAFQCVWPVVILLRYIFSDRYIGIPEFIFLVICSSAIVLLLLVCGKKNMSIRDFRFRDALPTVIWVVLPFIGEHQFLIFLGAFILFAAVVVATCFKKGPAETLKMGCDCLYYNAIVRPSNKLNFTKNLEDDFFERLQEQEDAEQEKLEAQIEKLSYLEELAQRHPPRRTPSIAVVVMAAVIATLALGFLFYASFVLLADPSFVNLETRVEKMYP